MTGPRNFSQKERAGEEPTVSVLMPTYNDAKYISNAIRSLLGQSHENWELIVIDGSTDNTPSIVRGFADNRIRYLREESSGQLNALATGVRYVQGKYVTILHSDDELLDTNAFKRNVTELEDSECDGVFSDLLMMDDNGVISGRARTLRNLTASSPAVLFLRGGSNIIPDFFFVKREAFENVLSNYVTWNIPYWLRFQESDVGTLDLRRVEPWYKYRRYSENYIRSEVGRFETISGCLRTVIEVGRRLDVPMFKIQRLMVRASKMRINPLFRHEPSSSKSLREMVRYVFDRYYTTIPENLYFKGLLGFYGNFPSSRTVSLHLEEDDKVFWGKDARVFFNLMETSSLPSIYVRLLEEAAEGFGKVTVADGDCEKTRTMLKFLNLLAEVERN